MKLSPSIQTPVYEIYVAGIPQNTKVSTLKTVFKRFGPLASIEILKAKETKYLKSSAKNASQFCKLRLASLEAYEAILEAQHVLPSGRQIFCEPFRKGDDLRRRTFNTNKRRIIVKRVPVEVSNELVKTQIEALAKGTLQTFYEFISPGSDNSPNFPNRNNSSSKHKKLFKSYSATLSSESEVQRLLAVTKNDPQSLTIFSSSLKKNVPIVIEKYEQNKKVNNHIKQTESSWSDKKAEHHKIKGSPRTPEVYGMTPISPVLNGANEEDFLLESRPLNDSNNLCSACYSHGCICSGPTNAPVEPFKKSSPYCCPETRQIPSNNRQLPGQNFKPSNITAFNEMAKIDGLQEPKPNKLSPFVYFEGYQTQPLEGKSLISIGEDAQESHLTIDNCHRCSQDGPEELNIPKNPMYSLKNHKFPTDETKVSPKPLKKPKESPSTDNTTNYRFNLGGPASYSGSSFCSPAPALIRRVLIKNPPRALNFSPLGSPILEVPSKPFKPSKNPNFPSPSVHTVQESGLGIFPKETPQLQKKHSHRA